MNNDKMIEKVANNRVFLYIIPNLLYIAILFNYYNNNYSDPLVLIVWDTLILIVLLFIISNILYFIQKTILGDYQKTFIIMLLLSPFLAVSLTTLAMVILLVLISIVLILLKKHKTLKCDRIIVLISFMVIIFFSFNIINFIPKAFKYIFHNKSYSNEMEIAADDTLPSPNIYWIHCDGMINISMANKYFNDQNQHLKKYLDKNFYTTNADATLVAGHKTFLALPALFNPNYYDNFYSKYLSELEKSYINETEPSYAITYAEVTNKRFDNELMKSLKEKGYTTISITRTDEYSSMYTDIIYDYYIGEDNQELRLLKNVSKQKLYLYTNYNRFMTKGIYNTILNPLVKNYNYLDYDVVDYKSINLKEYSTLNKTEYWPAKAIVKAINSSVSIEKSKFVFIDYYLNHAPFTYDEEGNTLKQSEGYSLYNFLGNYTYSSYLLIDILNYIKSVDKDAVIILQADHGLHIVPYEVLENSFNIDRVGALDIKNSVINSVYIPEKYKTGEEKYLKNPLNISRYLVNNYVNKDTYKYIKEKTSD